MSLELAGIEVNRPEPSIHIALRLVVVVRRRWIPALAPRRYRDRADAVPAEFHYRHEGVPVSAVAPARAGVGVAAARRERAPGGRGKGDRQTGEAVVERMGPIGAGTLEAVDLAPRRAPRNQRGIHRVCRPGE